MRLLKFLGSFLILLSFFLWLGNLWGMVAERDFKNLYLPLTLAIAGVVLFAIATLFDKTTTKTPLWAQLISGLTILVQLIMSIPIGNALLMVLYPLISDRGLKSVIQGYSQGFNVSLVFKLFILPVSIFVAAGYLRKKLRQIKKSN